MINLNFILLIFLIFLAIFTFKINFFSKIISIYDLPDTKRKFHKKKTPIVGWVYPFLALIFLFLISFFDNENNVFSEEIFTIYDEPNLRSYFSFFAGCLAIFFIGIFDDKKNISANNKIIFLIGILYLLISFDKDLTITELYLKIFDKSILLENFSLPFTILCIFFLINSLNLYDGINLQSSVFFIFIYSVLILKGLSSEILIFFLISNIFFAIKNYNGEIFYGDSGIYINSYVLSYFLIKSHNLSSSLSPELIFVILFLPSIDLLRLFVVRIIQLKNPFSGDRTHIHHILLKQFEENIYKANFVLILIFIIPYIIYDVLRANFYLSISISFIIYFLFIINFYRRVNK